MFDVRDTFSRKLRRGRVFLAGAAVLFGGGAALIPLLSAGTAGAIIGSQYSCSSPFLTVAPSSGYVPVGPAVHINNGTAASNNVELTASADANVTANAEMRLTWSIDGGAATDYHYGPGNIAEHQQFVGTRTVVDVAGGLGAGVHTIQPEVRISGASGTSGVVFRLCTLAQRNSN